MTEQLVHYSDRHIETVCSVEQTTFARFKPRGLWLSVDSCENNWKDWCEGEGFQLDHLTHAHDVRLRPDANILRIVIADDLDLFTEQFTRDPSDDFRSIGWADVALKYQGIIIAPYIWERRLHDSVNWYYAWDCASGCIWNADAVESITLRAQQ